MTRVFTPGERRDILRKFAERGPMTGEDFAKKSGLTVQTIYLWLRQRSQRRSSGVTVRTPIRKPSARQQLLLSIPPESREEQLEQENAILRRLLELAKRQGFDPLAGLPPVRLVRG